MSPLDALRTGTPVVAACGCGLGHRKGRIAPGYDAATLTCSPLTATGPSTSPRCSASVATATQHLTRVSLEWDPGGPPSGAAAPADSCAEEVAV